MGLGVDFYVYALQVVPDGLDGRDNLYVGGIFAYAGGGSIICRGLARWNGAYWNRVGDVQGSVYGFPNGSTVMALESCIVDGAPSLVIGGRFDRTGGHICENFGVFAGCPPSVPYHAPCQYVPAGPPISGADDLSTNLTDDRTTLLLSNSVVYRWTHGNPAIAIPGPTGMLGVSFARPPRINRNGVIAASVTDLSGHLQGGVYLRDQWHIIPPPTAAPGWCELYGINSENVVVGSRAEQTGITYYEEGFTWHDGVLTVLTHPIAPVLRPRAINDLGVVAGVYPAGGSDTLPFVMHNGRLTTLPMPPGTSQASVYAINSQGQVVGSVRLNNCQPNCQIPVRWHRDQVTVLPLLPNDHRGIAYGINDRGEIVGFSHNMQQSGSVPWTPRAVLWRNGELIDLSLLVASDDFWHFPRAYAINNAGDILSIYGWLLLPTVAPVADINSDCVVDANDLLIVIVEWGRPDSAADINHDGTVDVNDLLLVIVNWTI